MEVKTDRFSLVISAQYTAGISKPGWMGSGEKQEEAFVSKRGKVPMEWPEPGISDLLSRPLQCFKNAPLTFQPAGGFPEGGQSVSTRVGKESADLSEISKGEGRGGDIEAINVHNGKEDGWRQSEGGGRAGNSPSSSQGSHLDDRFVQKITARLQPGHAGANGGTESSGIFKMYFQRQVAVFLFVIVCVLLLFIWKKRTRRNKVKATKNRYARLRQIV